MEGVREGDQASPARREPLRYLRLARISYHRKWPLRYAAARAALASAALRTAGFTSEAVWTYSVDVCMSAPVHCKVDGSGCWSRSGCSGEPLRTIVCLLTDHMPRPHGAPAHSCCSLVPAKKHRLVPSALYRPYHGVVGSDVSKRKTGGGRPWSPSHPHGHGFAAATSVKRAWNSTDPTASSFRMNVTITEPPLHGNLFRATAPASRLHIAILAARVRAQRTPRCRTVRRCSSRSRVTRRRCATHSGERLGTDPSWPCRLLHPRSPGLWRLSP